MKLFEDGLTGFTFRGGLHEAISTTSVAELRERLFQKVHERLHIT